MAPTNAEHVLGDLEAVDDIFPSNEPYIMMNLVTFKPYATYSKTYQGPRLSGGTGREAYIKYVDMFLNRAKEMGLEVSIMFRGKTHTQIMAGPQEGESWDFVVLVKYTSWAAFKSLLRDTKYNEEIQPHRIAALQECRSFAVTERADI